RLRLQQTVALLVMARQPATEHLLPLPRKLRSTLISPVFGAETVSESCRINSRAARETDDRQRTPRFGAAGQSIARTSKRNPRTSGRSEASDIPVSTSLRSWKLDESVDSVAGHRRNRSRYDDARANLSSSD